MQHSVTEDQRRPMKLVVVVHSPGSMGGTPCVEIEHIAAGFDWNSGKLMFTPATPLTKLSPEDVEAIRESVAKGQSWHAYEAHKAINAKLNAAEAQRDLAVSQIDWLQKVNTLHRQVDILYVVDGYEVTITWDDNPVSEGFHGETVAEAISKAMAGFDLEKFTRVDGDIYGHERQMAALAAQRDELLAALEGLVGATESFCEGGYSQNADAAHEKARAVIAKAKGGAA